MSSWEGQLGGTRETPYVGVEPLMTRRDVLRAGASSSTDASLIPGQLQAAAGSKVPQNQQGFWQSSVPLCATPLPQALALPAAPPASSWLSVSKHLGHAWDAELGASSRLARSQQHQRPRAAA